MVVKRTKKKKKKRDYGASSSGGREMSPLRPKHVTKKPPCQDACPSGNRIREWLTTIAQAERLEKPKDQAFTEAWESYTDTSPFPSVCGRVCPHPCETGCNRTELEGAVGVNKVERVIGDFALSNNLKLKPLTDDGGFSCAYQLVRRGYSVTVFEAADKPGGMMLWGIPRYRLPEDIIAKEIQNIVDLGVELKLNTRIGKDISFDDIRAEYQAVFVAIGAEKGLKLRVEGEEADNVLSGAEFLNRIHHGEKIDVGDNVIVVGGGDTAIDAARICKRLGATVTIVYRRTIKEMPAIDEEIEEAQLEGVKLEYLCAPIGFNKDGDKITSMQSIRMELGEPDDSGRRRPVPIEGSEFDIPASMVIPAISQEPDFTGLDSLIEGRDWIKVDENYASTKVDGVYAGGDATNLALVTDAIGHGRYAAEAIDRRFRGEEKPADNQPIIKTDRMHLDHYEKAERAQSSTLPVEERFASFDAEANLPLSEAEAIAESKRCMSCGYCMDCEKCWMYCSDQAIEKPMQKGLLYPFKLGNCTGCKKCAEICPCGFIDME